MRGKSALLLSLLVLLVGQQAAASNSEVKLLV